MGTVCLKLGTSKRPGELDLAIRGVVARAIGTRRKNNREISRSSDSRRNRAKRLLRNGGGNGAAPLGWEPTTPHAGAGSGSRSANGRPGGPGPRAGGGTARNSAAGAGNPARNREWRIRDRARPTSRGGWRADPLETGGLGGDWEILWRSLAPGWRRRPEERRRESEAEGEGRRGRALISAAPARRSRGAVGPLN